MLTSGRCKCYALLVLSRPWAHGMGATSCAERCLTPCERDGGYLDLVTALPSHGCGAFEEELVEVECPAGAVFSETLEKLNALDRTLEPIAVFSHYPKGRSHNLKS